MALRRQLLTLGALAPLAAPAPGKSINLIVAFTAGGGTDIAARLVARCMERAASCRRCANWATTW